jgi:DNA (cytosine-5)-methyltransferase 1
MNELALFAGAGGGILGGKLLGWRTVCAVEIDAFCAAILAQRQDDGLLEPFPIWSDVRTFEGRSWRGRVDVVSGGFPCQGYSSASRGRIVAEDLWPEMRRIVADVAPSYVFAENVQRRAIDRAADDLEAMGYRVRCAVLSAADLGADHVRSRYWLRAHAHDESELCERLDAEMAMCEVVRPRVWDSEPWGTRIPDGMAHELDAIRATGNGQVPCVVAAAWNVLRADVRTV